MDESWRTEWQVDDDVSRIIPHALHTSGFALRFTFTDLDEDEVGWCPYVPDGYEERMDALRAKLGEAAIDELYAQAMQLWKELGYSDRSPLKGG